MQLCLGVGGLQFYQGDGLQCYQGVGQVEGFCRGRDGGVKDKGDTLVDGGVHVAQGLQLR